MKSIMIFVLSIIVLSNFLSIEATHLKRSQSINGGGKPKSRASETQACTTTIDCSGNTDEKTHFNNATGVCACVKPCETVLNCTSEAEKTHFDNKFGSCKCIKPCETVLNCGSNMKFDNVFGSCKCIPLSARASETQAPVKSKRESPKSLVSKGKKLDTKVDHNDNGEDSVAIEEEDSENEHDNYEN